MTGYKFLEEVVIGDICFEAEGESLEELFTNAGFAVEVSMVKLETVQEKDSKEFKLEHEDLDRLFIDFLDELIFLKDTEGFLVKRFELGLSESDGKQILDARVHGEEIDVDKHELEHDLKAITMHMFKFEKTDKGFYARVVIDI